MAATRYDPKTAEPRQHARWAAADPLTQEEAAGAACASCGEQAGSPACSSCSGGTSWVIPGPDSPPGPKKD